MRWKLYTIQASQSRARREAEQGSGEIQQENNMYQIQVICPLMPIDTIDSIHTIHAINLLPLPLPALLPLNSKRPQGLQVDAPQCALLRGLEVDPGHGAPRDAAALERPQGLEPPPRAQAPPAAPREARGPEVVALAGRVVEEVLGHDARQRVVPAVQRAGAAVAVAVEAGHGLG